jgi:hypothetical protein
MMSGGRAGWGLLAISVPVGIAAVVVMAVNVMLIASISRGVAPRRSPLFVTLAIVDLVAAACLSVGIAWNGDFVASPWLLLGLGLKGVLTLMLPAKQPDEPGAEDEHPPALSSPRK